MQHMQFSSTVILLNRLKDWKTMPTFGPVSVDLSLDVSDLFSMIEDPSAGLMFQPVDAPEQGGFP